MLIKVLHPREYPLLSRVPDSIVLSPEDSRAIVAMEGDEIVGRMYIVSMFHIEGTWVREDKRGSSALVRMSEEVENNLKDLGARGVLTFVEDDRFDKYLTRRGYKEMPWKVWGKEY